MIDNLNPKWGNLSLFRMLRNNRGEVDTGNPEAAAEAAAQEAAAAEAQKIADDAAAAAAKNDETPWYDTLGADFKENPSITKFKTPEELAKSYVNLEKMIGKEKVVLPGENATEDELAAFHKTLGRPEDIAGYQLPTIEGYDDLPGEVKISDAHGELFKQKALSLGLNNKQFSELYQFEVEMKQTLHAQEVKKAEEMAQATETALKTEWGAAYDKQVDGAQQVINAFFTGKEMHPAFKALSSDKGFVQAMAEISGKLGEDVIKGGPRLSMTPKEAAEEYNKMMGDLEHPFHKELHPEHQAAVDRSLVLQTAMLAGDK